MMQSHAAVVGKKQGILRLPQEHGAVVTFSIATVLALALSHSNIAAVPTGLILLWLLMLSAHNFVFLFSVSALGAVLLISQGYVLAALFLFAAFLAMETMQERNSGKEFWWRELVGLGGAVIAPFAMTSSISGCFNEMLFACLSLLAGVMTGLFLIHVSRPELKVSPTLTAVLSVVLWAILVALRPQLALVFALPFVVQLCWIRACRKPQYKQLGIAQGISLFWIAASLLLVG